jgi:hypothetical protein
VTAELLGLFGDVAIPAPRRPQPAEHTPRAPVRCPACRRTEAQTPIVSDDPLSRCAACYWAALPDPVPRQPPPAEGATLADLTERLNQLRAEWRTWHNLSPTAPTWTFRTSRLTELEAAGRVIAELIERTTP